MSEHAVLDAGSENPQLLPVGDLADHAGSLVADSRRGVAQVAPLDGVVQSGLGCGRELRPPQIDLLGGSEVVAGLLGDACGCGVHAGSSSVDASTSARCMIRMPERWRLS